MVRSHKAERGEHDPPLPSLAERRLIRVRAGGTQQYVADEILERWGLRVTRGMACRWERPVGYAGDGYRLPGREPSGAKRRAYAELLEEMRRMPPTTTTQRGRL